MGSAVSSPSGVRDGVPADNAFLGILGTEIAAGDNDFPSLWSEKMFKMKANQYLLLGWVPVKH